MVNMTPHEIASALGYTWEGHMYLVDVSVKEVEKQLEWLLENERIKNDGEILCIFISAHEHLHI
jgi:hypothetical protein